jgi:hypothetical protein
MRPLPLSLLIATLPSVALAEGWSYSTPRAPRRTPALLAGPVLTYEEGLGTQQVRRGTAGHLELGGSLPVGYEENELFLMVRAGGGAPGFGLSAYGGFRSVFGREEWQTFVDLGAAVHVQPDFWVGPRVGLGVRCSLSETFSLYGGLGAQLGFGSGLRLGVELNTGVRWSL